MKLSKCLLFLIAIALPSIQSHAQNNLKIVLVALNVTDIKASINWYKNTLGFELKSHNEYSDYGLEIAFLQKQGLELELVQNEKARQRNNHFQNELQIGISKLTFNVTNVVELYHSIQQQKVTIYKPLTSSNRDPLKQYFIVKDNDGNLLQFIGNSKKL